MHILGSSKRATKLVAGLFALTVPLSLGLAPGANAAPAPDIKVTQNYSDSIVTNDGISCTAGGIVSDNQYYRRFDLSVYGASTGFKVSKMTVGVEVAESSDSTVPGDFLVYAIDHTAELTIANLGAPLASVPVNYFSSTGSELISAAISATVPAGKDMVIEASVDEAPVTGDQVFYPGANEEAELGTTYLSSAGCGLAEPTPLADVGPFAGIANVLWVNGKTTDCSTAETAVNTATAAAAAAAAKVTAATAAVTTATAAVTKADGAVKKAKAKLKKAKQSGDANKVKKATAKLKKAKKAAKAAKAAQAAANTALTAAKSAVTIANTAVQAAQAQQTAKCAQPALPALPAPQAGRAATR